MKSKKKFFKKAKKMNFISVKSKKDFYTFFV